MKYVLIMIIITSCEKMKLWKLLLEQWINVCEMQLDAVSLSCHLYICSWHDINFCFIVNLQIGQTRRGKLKKEVALTNYVAFLHSCNKLLESQKCQGQRFVFQNFEYFLRILSFTWFEVGGTIFLDLLLLHFVS